MSERLSVQLILAWTVLTASNVFAASDPPPISAFAALPAISDVTISADGHYLAMISASKDRRVVLVLDRTHADAAPRPVLSDPDKTFHVRWCHWAMPTRLVCGFTGTVSDSALVYSISRLAAVDADGGNMKVLMQDSSAGVSQFQDRILDWKGAHPDTVLIQSTEDLLSASSRNAINGGSATAIGRLTSGVYPAVFELNVVNGSTTLSHHSLAPIRRYISDRHGQLRLAVGCCGSGDGKTLSYYVKAPDGGAWRKLLQYDAFSRTTVLRPVAIDSDDPNRAYALGLSNGRQALWTIDLNDKEPPNLIFDHPLADIETPILAKDGELLGVRYDTDTPHLFYTAPRAEAVATAVRKVLGDTYVTIVDSTADRSVYILRSSSDVDEGSYYLYVPAKGALEELGTAHPQLSAAMLGRLRTISYPARDGTVIPGYLMTPPGVRAEHLPLIVLPHGGPIARDTWRFDLLQQFLVSRGYAVLQMNFRGSSGYGDEWLSAAHQDWGGLTYSDIVDGARWAISSGVADPERVCIAGWSFGGYAALLAATRDSGLFRCSVSINGVSDLTLLLSERQSLSGYGIVREEIGRNSAKLAADSPRKHAEAVRIPVLMVHGNRDWQFPVEQSEDMAAALKRAGKAYDLVVIPDADNELSRESDRTTMLTAIEKFLRTHLGAGVVGNL